MVKRDGKGQRSSILPHRLFNDLCYQPCYALCCEWACLKERLSSFAVAAGAQKGLVWVGFGDALGKDHGWVRHPRQPVILTNQMLPL